MSSQPMRVVARLFGGLTTPPDRGIALDALLMSVEATRRQLPPVTVREIIDIDIPIDKEPGGRFHLASFSLAAGWDLYERRYVQRRFPIPQAIELAGPKLRRIDVAAGAQKSYRLPGEVSHPSGDTLEWYAVGDVDAVRDLLGDVSHIGKRRAVGRGKISEWTVEPCEPWGDGFPVARDGRALRTLPADWPGLIDPTLGYRVLSPPYWQHVREELCAVASGLA